MSVKQSDYETLLCEYINFDGAIALLKQHRLYLEKIPSLRRPQESLIIIPLPIVKIHSPRPSLGGSFSSIPADEAVGLPCDLAMLMCDPTWKVKIGPEILVFIHRPGEDFSGLLGRWRQTQIYLDKDYEWLMPLEKQHIFSERAERIYPLFVVYKDSPERIERGLTGAGLPCIVETLESKSEGKPTEAIPAD